MQLKISGVQLDYSNLYLESGESVVIPATLVLEKCDDEIFVAFAIAEESNDVFGVQIGDEFDPGEIDVQQFLNDY
jgi:hypothetical protein